MPRHVLSNTYTRIKIRAVNPPNKREDVRFAVCLCALRLTDTEKTITTDAVAATVGIASTSIMKSRLKTFVGDGQERREMIGG